MRNKFQEGVHTLLKKEQSKRRKRTYRGGCGQPPIEVGKKAGNCGSFGFKKRGEENYILLWRRRVGRLGVSRRDKLSKKGRGVASAWDEVE